MTGGSAVRTASERTAVLATVGFALVWLVATVARPHTTFHLAPVVVAASWPIAVRAVRRRPLEDRAAAAGALAGFAVVSLVLGLLAATGSLDGPALVPAGGTVGESFLGGLIGAGYGWWVAVREKHAWYLGRPEGR